jgi:hydrogenase nickel incorporation protein HypA/HybF
MGDYFFFDKLKKMHEFSIAESIIDIAVDTMYKNNGKVLNEIELEIGTASGIEVSALKLALSALLKNSFENHVSVHVIKIKAIAFCTICQKEFETDDPFPFCPGCNTFCSSLKQGKELKVKSIQID